MSSQQKKLNSEQKNAMETHMREFPLTTKYSNVTMAERIQQNILWDQLVAKLNALGPPIRTQSDWRKTWSTLKYKTKVSKSKKTWKKRKGVLTDDDESEADPLSESSEYLENRLRSIKKEVDEEGEEDTDSLNMKFEAGPVSIDLPSEPLNPRARMKQYFDCFSESVLALPEDLQLKCRNEIFTVIVRYESLASRQTS